MVNMKTNEAFAAKIVPKKLINRHNLQDKIKQEVLIHKSLKHKNVVSFHSFLEDYNFVYIILELCRKRSMLELRK